MEYVLANLECSNFKNGGHVPPTFLLSKIFFIDKNNNLAILSTHKDLTDTINFVDIGNEFAAKYDVRRKIYS